MKRIKKTFAIAFLAMLVSSNAFALRNLVEVFVNGELSDIWCEGSGGTCFDDVIIEG